MNFLSCLKCSQVIYKKNKDKFFISILISIISSFVCLFFLFLSFSFHQNVDLIENKAIEDSRIILTANNLYTGIDKYIELGNKYNCRAIIRRNIYITLFDFEKDYSHELEIVNGNLPKNNNILANSNSNYNIGDKVLLDELEYNVCGIYESNFYNGFIGNLLEFNDEMEFYQLTFIYYGEDLKKDYNKIEKFIEEVNIEGFNSELVTNYIKNKHKNNVILTFFIAVTIIFFILTFFFYVNSISMSFDEAKRYIFMLKVMGINKRDLFLSLFIYSFIIALIGSIISFILLFAISYIIDVKKIFNTFIISNFFIDLLMDFDYVYVFPWYIIFLLILFYFISVSLVSLVYVNKYYENCMIKE